MKTNFFILNILLALISPVSSFGKGPKMIFEQNKNQWPEQVLFKTDIPGGNLFLEKNTLTYNYIENINWHRDHKNESGGPVKVKYHSIRVSFLNSNPNVEVLGNNLLEGHRNYYIGNDPKSWASNVPLYEEAYYKELYENIDMHLYNVDNNFKYDFIIQPGGNPKNIVLNYNGPDAMRIENGHLFIKTSLYDLIEQKPFAYQEINGVKTEVPCSYILKKNKISFEIGSDYDKSLPLIIDPTLIAATYSGSNADNWGFTATYDNAANIYIGGIAARAGYPYTTGAWDATFNGGLGASTTQWPFDISLSKFNPTGTTLLFATYYGGSSNEQPHSLMVNSSNELFVAGRTNSANFPVTAGAYVQPNKGGYEIIIGKFNSVGNLLASTTVGGTGDDGVNVSISWTVYSTLKYNYTDDGRSEIFLDNNSNVYVAGSTRSTNFPATAGCDNTLGGTQDGCVIKMNSTLTTLLFSTYLGGSGIDAAYGLKTDNSNNVYVTGGTTSNDFPTTAGVVYPTFQGGTADAFISVLNSSGVMIRATYLGTSAYDQAYLLEIDASGDIYVFGQTKGVYPTTAGVYKNANSGQFIHKLNGLLNSTVFSTVVGKGGLTPNISPTAFLVDSCQTIYIAGWGRSCALDNTADCSNTACTGLPITANAQQATTDGGDFYFMVLTPNAQALWYATFYGENYIDPPDPFAIPAYPGGPLDHVDGGTSRFDQRGVIYEACCASCGGTQGFPTTPGAYSIVNHGTVPTPYTGYNCNEAVIKMDVSPKPLAVANLIGSPNGCAPHAVSFNNAGSSAAYFIWDFGDGSPIDTLVNPSHTYSFVGTYTLTLFAVDSIGICGFIDTATLVVNVGAAPTLAAAATNILCNSGVGSATVTPTGGMLPYTYSWQTAPVQTTSVATGLTPGTYTVTVKDYIGCSTTTTIAITQPPPLTLTVSATQAICGVPTGSATANAGGGTPNYTYSWSTTPVQTTSTASGLTSGSYSVILTDQNGCTNSGSVSVAVANGPTVTATGGNPILCFGGTNGTASSNPVGGATPYTYSWSTSPQQTTQTATGLSAGITYTVIVTDSNNCSSFSTVGLSQPPQLATSISSTNISCYLGANGTATVTATGGTPGYTYLWSTLPAQTGTIAAGLSSGTSYTVSVTDANQCTSTHTVILTQPTAVVPSITSVNPSCFGGNNGTATASATGGTPGYTYIWNTTPPQSGPTATGFSSGPTYTVTVTDSKGCTKTQSVTLSQPTAVTINTSVSGYSCGGTSPNGSASASPGGGTPPYSFAWSNGQSTASAANLIAGTYTVIVTDSKGCTQSSTAIILPTPVPTAAFTVDSAVSCDGIIFKFTNHSSAGSSLSWNFGDGVTSALQDPVHIFPYNATYVVSLIVTNTPCKDTATIVLHVGDMTTYASIGAANIFTPNSDGSNDCFRPALIGPGADTLAACISLEVYDRWGVNVFKSDNAIRCWDGNVYKNGKPGKPAIDGTYYYIAKLGNTTINNYVTLVRNKN